MIGRPKLTGEEFALEVKRMREFYDLLPMLGESRERINNLDGHGHNPRVYNGGSYFRCPVEDVRTLLEMMD